jgi:sugar lactone lactonase YvrE
MNMIIELLKEKGLQKPTLIKGAIALTLVFGFTACKKSDSPAGAPPPPVDDKVAITSVSPDNGPKGTVVKIAGSGFSSTLASNTVTFNGDTAVVTAATTSELTVQVPAKAGTGAVAVYVKEKSATGPTFNYVYSVTVSSFAGSTSGNVDGTGTGAKFYRAISVSSDSQGNIYVVDELNNNFRKITPGAVVSTIAGGTQGDLNGLGLAAQFHEPMASCPDAHGNLYVADEGNHKIKKIAADGNVTTIAGSTSGNVDGTGSDAKFAVPVGMCIDSKGNLFVLDYGNHNIRKVTPDGVVTTIAGGTNGYADGTGPDAQFSDLAAICIDSHDNMYVADRGNLRVRKVTPEGVVTTIAGSSMQGDLDGPALSAKFYNITGIVADAQGNIFVTDQVNKIKEITTDGNVVTIAGLTASTGGLTDGPGLSAQFNEPFGICIDPQGNLYVADTGNFTIRKVVID